MAPPLPELMEELVEEILLRFPPDDDSASLRRAALVCKLWRRLVCSAAFRRRFLEFHRSTARLLGVLCTEDSEVRGVDGRILPRAYFVPTTSSFRPAIHRRRRLSWRAIDARHGRVLICRSDHGQDHLLVCDPVTDERRDLPAPPFDLAEYPDKWNAAVTCAAAAGGGNCCDHINCRRGPFLVVLMVMDDFIFHSIYLSVYSSEAAAWSKKTICQRPTRNSFFFSPLPGVLVRSSFYFLVHFNDEIVEYDMATQKVPTPTIRLPYRFRRRLKRSIVLMTGDGGGLGFAANVKDKVELWSMRVACADGDARFVLTRVIDLRKVLPSGAVMKHSTQVNGFADGGARRFLFIKMFDGLYSIEINSSSHVRKIGNCSGDEDVVPYISFLNSGVQH